MKKATKIIGAVLGVLLVAALFTGAAAAADNENNLGDVYIWQLYKGFPYEGTEWSNGTDTVKFLADPNLDGWYYLADDVAEGTYSYTIGTTTYKINVKSSGAAPSGSVLNTEKKAIANLANATVDKQFYIRFDQDNLAFTGPNGLVTTEPTEFGMELVATEDEIADQEDIVDKAKAALEVADAKLDGALKIADVVEEASTPIGAMAKAEVVLDDLKGNEKEGAQAVYDALAALIASDKWTTEDEALFAAREAAQAVVAGYEADAKIAETFAGVITTVKNGIDCYRLNVLLPYVAAEYNVEAAALKDEAKITIGAFDDASSVSAAFHAMLDAAITNVKDNTAAGALDVDHHAKWATDVVPATLTTYQGVVDEFKATSIENPTAGDTFKETVKAEIRAIIVGSKEWNLANVTAAVSAFPGNNEAEKSSVALNIAKLVAINHYTDSTADAVIGNNQIQTAVQSLYDIAADGSFDLITIQEVAGENLEFLAAAYPGELIVQNFIDAAYNTPAGADDAATVTAIKAAVNAIKTQANISAEAAGLVKAAVYGPSVKTLADAKIAAAAEAAKVVADTNIIYSGYTYSYAELAAAKVADAVCHVNASTVSDLVDAADLACVPFKVTYLAAFKAYNDGSETLEQLLNTYKLDNVDELGDYFAQTVVKRGSSEEWTGYSSLAPANMLGNPTYFAIGKASETKTLTALSDEVLQGGIVEVVLEAPYNPDGYTIEVENGIIPAGQPGVTYITDGDTDAAYIPVELAGSASFIVKATSTDNVKVKLMKQDEVTGKWLPEKTLNIKVVAAKITIDDDVNAATYIGNSVKITGTNQLGGTLSVFIKGPNFDFAPVAGDALTKVPVGKVWEAEINTGLLKSNTEKRPDAGNYTLYFAKLTKNADVKKAADLDDSKNCDAYTTVVVALKQPFINITEAPAVVVKGDHLVIKGTAEGQPAEIQYYIFGTNFFYSNTESVNDDGVFEIDKEITKEGKLAGVKDMGAGQYFAVFQHPMYDTVFNIAPGTSDDKKHLIYKNTKGAATENDTVIINTNERQSANAAQALCDELDDQKVDDMYVKASFFVAGASSVIGAIPEQIVKGEKLTVSGVAVGHKKEVVSVELLSTAFAAVPKETVGSASFVSATARVDDDGLWTVTIDTSDLNADDYTISVAVGSLDSATQKIKIVEGTVPKPTTQPTTQPTAQPTAQPTQTPASPGFGILAALAGLGAVAVLLLRRQ